MSKGKEKKPKVGRPKFIIDYDAVERLASIMATQEEIAHFLGCSVRTLQRDEEFSHVYKRGLDKGKLSLRRKQFKMSDRNATMAIWLGKQYLGQTDVMQQDIRVESREDESVQEMQKYINKLKARDKEDGK